MSNTSTDPLSSHDSACTVPLVVKIIKTPMELAIDLVLFYRNKNNITKNSITAFGKLSSDEVDKIIHSYNVSIEEFNEMCNVKLQTIIRSDINNHLNDLVKFSRIMDVDHEKILGNCLSYEKSYILEKTNGHDDGCVFRGDSGFVLTGPKTGHKITYICSGCNVYLRISISEDGTKTENTYTKRADVIMFLSSMDSEELQKIISASQRSYDLL